MSEKTNKFRAPRFDAGRDAGEESGMNPDAPIGGALPQFARPLPKVETDIPLAALRMMTPRTVPSARSTIVMTPRATPSRFDGPKVPSSSAAAGGKGSKLKVISGPSKSAQEKSLFESSYTDRAASRRADSEDNATEKTFVKLDFNEVDEKRRLMAEVRQDEPFHEETESSVVFAEKSRCILLGMRLLEAEVRNPDVSTSLWSPGRSSLIFDFKSASGMQPQVQVRSQAEIDALGLASKTAKTVQFEQRLIDAVHRALNPSNSPAKKTEIQIEGSSSKISDTSTMDMFADDVSVSVLGKETRHKDRIISSGKRPDITTSQANIPESVRNILSAQSTRDQNSDSNDEEDVVSGSTTQDYEECFPGVYESGGIEYGSSASEDDDDNRGQSAGAQKKNTLVGRKRLAGMEQRRAKRKFDREASQVERIMKDKFGAPD